MKDYKNKKAIAFKKQLKTLGDLYTDSAKEKPGKILIDANFAASASGATCTVRLEKTVNEQTLFLSMQHPGEVYGLRQGGATDYQDCKLSMLTLDGQEFEQTRRVPIVSNWLNKTPKALPKPAVAAVRWQDAQPITTLN